LALRRHTLLRLALWLLRGLRGLANTLQNLLRNGGLRLLARHQRHVLLGMCFVDFVGFSRQSQLDRIVLVCHCKRLQLLRRHLEQLHTQCVK
jgi:hypothetical protein